VTLSHDGPGIRSAFHFAEKKSLDSRCIGLSAGSSTTWE
jgi:hypothetical protein